MYLQLLIVLGVNVLIFPISAEREMREILVNSLSVLPFHLCDAYSFSETFFISLDRVASFSHLIAKTYSLELSEEERKIRDVLAMDIKNDIGFVASKIQETSFEVNYSRFSMESYQVTTQRLRQMQQVSEDSSSPVLGLLLTRWRFFFYLSRSPFRRV